MQNLKDEKKFSPPDAAVKLYRYFRKVAREMSKRCVFTRDDIAQEMALAVLECKGENSLAYYKSRAKWRAMDYVRRMQIQTMHECRLTAAHRNTIAAPSAETHQAETVRIAEKIPNALRAGA